ncbi:MAG: sugar isomerase domain-containing protein, partial [Clostridia bacterium]|nr:sugar isomerase domain-containing protein [Clostridia bacterium]
MKKYLEYIDNCRSIIEKISTEGKESIERTADLFTETMISGKRLYLFGTGHSHMLAEELFYRAGGLVNVQPILVEPLMLHISASDSTTAERVEGYADKIFAEYRLSKDDTIIIISNSGRNGVIVDMA